MQHTSTSTYMYWRVQIPLNSVMGRAALNANNDHRIKENSSTPQGPRVMPFPVCVRRIIVTISDICICMNKQEHDPCTQQLLCANTQTLQYTLYTGNIPWLTSKQKGLPLAVATPWLMPGWLPAFNILHNGYGTLITLFNCRWLPVLANYIQGTFVLTYMCKRTTW